MFLSMPKRVAVRRGLMVAGGVAAAIIVAVASVAVTTQILPASATSKHSNSIDKAAKQAVACVQPRVSQKVIRHNIDQVLAKGGVTPDEVKIGSQVDFSLDPNVRGTAAMTVKTLKTRTQVSNFLNGKFEGSADLHRRAELNRIKVAESLVNLKGELPRALNGTGYIPIQFTVGVQYFGLSYFTHDQVMIEHGARQVGPNDLLWVFVTCDGKVVLGASIRADCVNGHVTKIVVVLMSTPPAPPVSTPPSHHQPPPTTLPTTPTTCVETGRPPVQGVCGKHDSQSPVYNKKVPNTPKGCGKDGLPSGQCKNQGKTPPSPISTFKNVGTDGYPTGKSPNTTTVPTTTLPPCPYRDPSGTCSSRPVVTAPPVDGGGGTPVTNPPVPSSS